MICNETTEQTNSHSAGCTNYFLFINYASNQFLSLEESILTIVNSDIEVHN
jgi:hypothetical protein